MKFTDAVKSVYSHYSTFSGRARRSEYWYYVLFNTLVSFVYAFLIVALEDGFFFNIVNLSYVLFVLGSFIPRLAVVWRRLHDTGHSGWWLFISLIPTVGIILLFIWLCKDGQRGPNQYGPDPKFPAGEFPWEKAPWEY